ncbi:MULTISPECIES: DUF6129 family protein [Cohaesibacter]|uniref:DUF6129 family protein n=1 Tax=Cohaesibacter TaxID=655352 RepID=UPI000DEB5127|nr:MULTISPECIES: DUF6129 family protein [Cohaesibacter]TLP44251.1 hypothetical protein FDK21_15765 [Cohaesibacter sp. CAU 1516]
MIDDAVLDGVCARVAGQVLGPDISAGLRSHWPDIHFTYCQDDDIVAAKPVREAAAFNLYLVTSGGGCIAFTSQVEQATGIVIAELEQGEVEDNPS